MSANIILPKPSALSSNNIINLAPVGSIGPSSSTGLNLALNSNGGSSSAGLNLTTQSPSVVTMSSVESTSPNSWSRQHQPLFTRLLKQAVIDLCMQNLAWDGKLEIDGILCISNGVDPARQIIVKVHEALIKQSLGDISNLMPVKIPNGPLPPATSTSSTVTAKVSPGVAQPTRTSPRKLAPKSQQTTANGEPMPLMRSLLAKNLQPGMSGKSQQKIVRIDPSGLSPKKIIKRPLAMMSGVAVHDENKEGEGSEEENKICKPLKDDKTFICKICSVSFQSFSSLQGHNHAKHSRYTCKMCHGTFSLRCNLRRHERLHAGVKPFKCDLCKKSFSRSADLQGHLKKHGDEAGFQWINCSQCPKAFKSSFSLRIHMFKVHKIKDSIYSCSICEQVFSDPDEFQAHRATHAASLVHISRALAKKGGNTDSPSPALSGASMESAQTSGDTEEFSDGALQDKGASNTDDARAMSRGYESGPSGSNTPSQKPDEMGAADSMPVNLSLVKTEPKTEEEMAEMAACTSLLHDEMPGYDATSEMNMDSKPEADAMFPMEEPGVDDDSLGFDRPLVINIKPELDQEVDSNSESRTMSGRPNRRKSRPVRFIQQDDSTDGKDDAEDDMYPMEMPATSGMDLSVRKLETTGSDPEPQQPVKRIRVEDETGLVQYESLEQLMSRVNESLYMNCSMEDTVKKKTTPKVSGSSKKRRAPGSEPRVSLRSLVLSDIPSDRSMEEKVFTCTQWGCTVTCQGFTKYEDHSLSVHGRFPCKYCQQTFGGRNNRTRHMRYHVTGKQHPCPSCGKFFTRPDSLKEHRFIHTRSYQDSICRNCNLRFEKKATLLAHLKKCFTDDQLEEDKFLPSEEDVKIQSRTRGLKVNLGSASNANVFEAGVCEDSSQSQETNEETAANSAVENETTVLEITKDDQEGMDVDIQEGESGLENSGKEPEIVGFFSLNDPQFTGVGSTEEDQDGEDGQNIVEDGEEAKDAEDGEFGGVEAEEDKNDKDAPFIGMDSEEEKDGEDTE